MTTTYQVHSDVAVITLDNPPVNGLNWQTRKECLSHLEKALADPSIHAMVLYGAGKAFCGGADIKEFGTPKAMQEPNLLSLILAFENAQKPLVAALHSVVMGGGLELSLACHYRVASPGCQIALPEVKLGLIPGAGGTQRLPRVLGVEVALNMIVSGEPVMSERLNMVPGQKLFDQMAASSDTLLDEAIEFARSVSADRPLPKVRDLKSRHPQGDAYFQFAKNMVKNSPQAKNLPAPLQAIDAVQQSTLLPMTQGLAYERERFLNLMWTPESRALRHLFGAQRNTSKIADLDKNTPIRPIQKVGIIGSGTMGGGIAMNFLMAGLPVTLLDTSQAALDKGVQTLTQNFQDRVHKGKLKADKLQSMLSALTTTLAYEDLSPCDLIIEAVFEDLSVKEKVFQAMDACAKAGAILATNTSTLDVNAIAAFTKRPADVVGMHFFSPANVMKLLEVVRAKETSKDVLASVMALSKTIKKIAVVSGVCDGFIGNRMIEQYLRQAGFLLEEGCSPAQIDQAIERFGFAMGPFKMSDLAGNDIGWAIRQRRYVEKPQMKYSPMADLICPLGRFGQKTSAGWYDYKAGKRDAIHSPLVQKLLDDYRAEHALKARKISDEEIVQRLVFSLVNEGARILQEGIASKASDIDMVYITGYGFPIFRGGPMHYAQEFGLLNMIGAMQRFALNPKDDAQFWQPAALLQTLAHEGRTFADA